MRWRFLIVLVLMTLLVSCSSTQLNRSSYILNRSLWKAYRNYDKTWNKNRPNLKFSGGGIANNCTTYFNLAAKYDFDESIYNQTVRSVYLICDTLRILSRSPNIYYKRTRTTDFGGKLASKLDLRSFPSSLFRFSDEAKHTLNSLHPVDVTHKGAGAVFETKDWIFHLEVVAVTHINDNAAPDWIVWMSDEAKSGNYRSYATLIVYDPGEKVDYVATFYP